MGFRDWIAVRYRATVIAAAAVLGSWVALNVIFGVGDASTLARLSVRAAETLSYPSSLLVGAMISGCAFLFAIWAKRDGGVRSWLLLALVLLALGPAVMVFQDVLVTINLPHATPPVAVDAFSGLLYSLVTTGLGLLVGLLVARLTRRPANKRIERTV